MLETRHTVDLPGHHAPAVEQQEDGLVALGAVGADDELCGARRRGPVDAAELVVGCVLAELVELGARTAPLCRSQPDLEDASAVAEGTRIDVELARGGLGARVEDVRP